MLKIAFSNGIAIFGIFIGLAIPIQANRSGENEQICEVKPILKCLDKEKIEGDTLRVGAQDMAIARDGFLICDSSFNYTTSPDIVLIMDNTGSMDSVGEKDGIARWCPDLNVEKVDIGCISGDPRRQRGPALQTFIDSAVAKGGVGMNVGVVTFSDGADPKSNTLIPLTASTKEAIKASIVMKESGNTNYTAAFNAARNLLASSKKPIQEQFIIFVSDGRPNEPEVNPFYYKTYWDSLPTVHSIFLGENKDNFSAMQEISRHTGGDFFNISDVGLLAKILTDDLAKKLFRRALPTRTLVQNKTQSIAFNVNENQHALASDSTSYILQMPGPLYLKTGINNIIIKTEYGYGGTSQDLHFFIERSETGPFSDFSKTCRDYPELVLYNTQNQPISSFGQPYSINDSLLRYSLTTGAKGLDSFNVTLKTQSPITSQQDLEVIINTARSGLKT